LVAPGPSGAAAGGRRFDERRSWRYAFFVTSEPAGGPDLEESEVDRSRLERLIPVLVKRILEAGIDRLHDSPDSVRRLMSELRLPREALNAILSQIDESKSGLYRVVAKEVRDFLGKTNFADELTRALTSLSFEIRTEVRFIPNDARGRPSPDVRSKVSVKKRPSTPPPHDETPAPPERETEPAVTPEEI
jgi:hypothetical protein